MPVEEKYKLSMSRDKGKPGLKVIPKVFLRKILKYSCKRTKTDTDSHSYNMCTKNST